MDALTFGSLFSGIGGIDLGLERAGWVCKWQIEKDRFCRSVLEKHWPDIPKYVNIQEVDFEHIGHVSLLAGGFPCQSVSSAGKKRVCDDPRWLWPHFARAIRTIRPRFAFIENVAGLLHRGFEFVLADLAACGYDAEWQMLPAASVGAPHIRQRVWAVAYPAAWRWERHGNVPEGTPIVFGRGLAPAARAEIEGKNHWATEPNVGRMVHGFSNGVDGHRVKALGNSAVPQIPEYIGTILRALI